MRLTVMIGNPMIARRRVAQNKITVVKNGVGSNALFEVSCEQMKMF